MKDPLRQTRYWMTETDSVRLPTSLAEVAFVGRSNVGKSSTICAICDNKKLARVSKMPGRTRGINVFEVIRDRWLVDLPGYGYAAAPEKQRDYWPKMIGNYLSNRPNLTRVFVLLDAELGVGPMDLSMFNWLKEGKIPYRAVGTKIDRIAPTRRPEFRARMADLLGFLPTDIHWTSAKERYGIDPLRKEVTEALEL